MDERSKPSSGFWCTVVLVGLMILYPLSFGPACWLSEREVPGTAAVSALYRPVLAFAPEGRLSGPLGWYACLGAREDAFPMLENRNLRWRKYMAGYKLLGPIPMTTASPFATTPATTPASDPP